MFLWRTPHHPQSWLVYGIACATKKRHGIPHDFRVVRLQRLSVGPLGPGFLDVGFEVAKNEDVPGRKTEKAWDRLRFCVFFVGCSEQNEDWTKRSRKGVKQKWYGSKIRPKTTRWDNKKKVDRTNIFWPKDLTSGCQKSWWGIHGATNMLLNRQSDGHGLHNSENDSYVAKWQTILGLFC